MVVVDFQGQIIDAAAKSLNLLSMALRREFSPLSPPLVADDSVPGSVQQLLVLLQKAILGETAAAHRDRWAVGAFSAQRLRVGR